ncbi:MAG: hypothetical protein QXT10_01520 [Candidatus Bathyarchaeia archaeon]
MKTNYKKIAKLVTLLATSLLIATASAAIYDYMYLNATVGVQGMALAWVKGADGDDAGTNINGVTAALTKLKGPPNGTRIYADPIRLNNTSAQNVNFDLLIDTVSGSTDQLSSIIIRIYDMNASVWVQNITIWGNGQKGNDVSLTIQGNHMWRFQWEITWKSTATTSHSVTVNLKVRVPV